MDQCRSGKRLMRVSSSSNSGSGSGSSSDSIGGSSRSNMRVVSKT